MAAAVVVSDQLTKFAVRSCLEPAHSVPVIPPVLLLTYVQNTGAAFGLFRGYPGVFVLLSVAVMGWILLEFLRKERLTWSTEMGLALILGGALGNVIDRLRYGYVIDFIDVRVWPVFNAADSAITIGVTLLILDQFGFLHKKARS